MTSVTKRKKKKKNTSDSRYPLCYPEECAQFARGEGNVAPCLSHQETLWFQRRCVLGKTTLQLGTVRYLQDVGEAPMKSVKLMIIINTPGINPNCV